MTDNEIFANEILCIRRRATGRCNGGTDCCNCDLRMDETEIITAYQRAMKQNDLIDRQKADIERWNKELNIIRAYIHDNGLEWDLLSYSKRNGR